jgi:CheY-specific phosphatase CheX
MNPTENPTEKKFKVSDHMANIVSHVFETMLALPATPVPAGPLAADRVSGAIGIAGDDLTATVYLHFPGNLANGVARAMLQTPPDQAPGDADVNDVIGEITNMVGARLKSILNDADVYCAVSTPSVIRGAFAVDAPHDVIAETFYFSCLDQRLAVEVHLQFAEVNL